MPKELLLAINSILLNTSLPEYFEDWQEVSVRIKAGKYYWNSAARRYHLMNRPCRDLLQPFIRSDEKVVTQAREVLGV